MKPKQALAVIRAHQAAMRTERDKLDRFHDWYLADTDRVRADWDDYTPGGVEDNLSLETNFPYAFVDTMVAGVCPTNPQITISSLYDDKGGVGRAREMLANDTMRINKLYKKGWRAAGHAAIAGYGITKTVWDMRKRRPYTRNINPRRFFWDRSADEWEDVTYCIEATVLRREQFMARAKRRRMPGGLSKPAQYKASVAENATYGDWPEWLKKPNADSRSMGRDGARGVFEHVVVYEVYDFMGGNYYHMLDNVEEPLFESELPYKWVRNPFDLIAFNDNLNDTTGISDIHLIANLQERLNELDTLELWFILQSMPIALVDEKSLENPEAFFDALQNASGPGAHVRANVKNGRSIGDIIAQTPTPNLPPNWQAARARIERMIEFVLAMPKFLRGETGNADLATEAALADAGIRTRNGRRVRIMEEWQSSVAMKYIALWGEMHTAGRPIPVKEPTKKEAVLLEPEDLGFEDPASFEENYYFRYDAAPYSPTENHALVQLQKIQQYAPILAENEWVDKEKFITKLLELLKLSEIKGDGPTQEPMAMPGTPGMPGSAGVPGTDGLPPELAQAQAFIANAQPAPPGVSEAPVEL